MNELSIEKQIEIVATLAEGCSIRSTGRLTGTHRDTVMRLGLRNGEGCLLVHDRLLRKLNIALIQIDELWSYVGKKQKRVTADDADDVGDQYIFTALDPVSRCLLTTYIGKRDRENTLLFLNDLRGRVLNRPPISSGAFGPYPEAIACTFGINVDYAQIVKPSKEGFPFPPPWQRRSRAKEEVKKHLLWGEPVQSEVSTSLVERSNLTARQHSRRLARMSDGFSKKQRNHRASISLFAAHYNLCRVHETIRMTPGVALGVADHTWTIEEVIRAATQPEAVPERLSPFTLINGGLS